MIAIIPARGGSKRIPRKNIRPFFGIPILERVIDELKASGLFSSIFVSTDDPEIAEIALKQGAEVPLLRSTINSNDFATTSDVLLEVFDYLNSVGRSYETACCIYPTSVLVSPEDLFQAHSFFNEKKASVLLACVSYSHPIHRSFTIKNNRIELQFPELINNRSQDLPISYHDTGSFYFFNVPNFLTSKTLWQEQIIPFVMPENKVQDIDNEEDWMLAELKFKRLRHESV